MSDSDSKPDAPSVPSWQRAQPEEAAVESAAAPESSTEGTETDVEIDTQAESTTTEDVVVTPASEEDKLDVARKFLDDENVRDAPRDQKIAFLKSKDIADDDIQTLLGDEPTPSASEPREVPITQPAPQSASTSTQTASAPPTEQPQQPPSSTPDRAPIVTYPEFLAKPARHPPLVTTNRLLNTLYAVVGLSTLVYGTGKSVIQPMVQSQTDARAELHETTARNLDALVAKLEKTVSEIPPPPKKQPTRTSVDGAESEAEDPAELFHRDMGTQTTFPLNTSAKDSKNEATTKRQAEQLAGLTKSLSSLKDGVRSQSEGMQNLKNLMDEFSNDLDSLKFEGKGVSTFDIYGRSRDKEPEDGIRKVKENIRRIKGALLSTRNFPTVTR
ncbi:peroxisomal membrane anchor protein conserved region-domain-containing protein [Thelonectria olida]|uniref:Peroxisomal membrane protein PEX14 n=1 Tax=Thelonectria olida TaxID=1576542 RepID=A0A9P9AMH5_9HYPO|nr:peroxisomal membrane anchor protein conserved region-domain-containing protein [Thelonectria olida]